MSTKTKYETQRIDHLGTVTGISWEIGLVETIDEMVGQTGRKVSCGEGVKAYCEHLADGKKPYFVMDSAGYNENSLKAIQNMLWLMRAPETLAEAKRLVKETAQDQMVELAPGYLGKEVKSDYGGVAQRWLVVFSLAACERELKTLGKAQAREQENAEKQWCKVCQAVSNCQEDAEAACKQVNQRWKYHRATELVTPIRQYAHSGRPAAGAQPDVVGYMLTGSVELYEAGIEEAKPSLGKFIVATNELEVQNLPAAAMLENYTPKVSQWNGVSAFSKTPCSSLTACS